MNFRFTEEQEALRALAREILEGEVTPERQKAVDAAGEGFDRETWRRLADANLLGVAIPEAQGGMGMRFLELCLLCVEAGRAVAHLPVVPALVAAGLPLARYGSDAQRARWLAPLAAGDLVLGAALDIAAPPRARRKAGAIHVDGVARQVSAAGVAARVAVPIELDGAPALLFADPAAAGVTRAEYMASHGAPLSELTFADATFGDEDVLDDPAAALRDHALVATAATQLGVCERALEITVAYVTEREQFGAPLGALPAVQHRCADAYIALDALRWITWQAAWKLSEGRDATRDAQVAKFWAADAGSRITTATQHLHGGMGVDLDYPVHRTFLFAKHLELELGGATPQLAALGRDMARTRPQARTA